MSIQGKSTQLILSVSAAGAGASFFFQLGPDVGAVAFFELSGVATCTLEGRLDPGGTFLQLRDQVAGLISVVGATPTNTVIFIGRMASEIRANVTAYTGGTVKVWIMA